jgi:hypothetical protein
MGLIGFGLLKPQTLFVREHLILLQLEELKYPKLMEKPDL